MTRLPSRWCCTPVAALAAVVAPAAPPAVAQSPTSTQQWLETSEPGAVVAEAQSLLSLLHAQGVRLDPNLDPGLLTAAGLAAVPGDTRLPALFMRSASVPPDASLLATLRRHVALAVPPGHDAIHLLAPAALDALALDATLRGPLGALPVVPFALRVAPVAEPGMRLLEAYKLLDAREPRVFSETCATGDLPAAAEALAAALRRAALDAGRLRDQLDGLVASVPPARHWPLVVPAPPGTAPAGLAERAALWLRDHDGYLFLTVQPHHMLKVDALDAQDRRDTVRLSAVALPESGFLVRGEVREIELVHALRDPIPPALWDSLWDFIGGAGAEREFPPVRDAQGAEVRLGYRVDLDQTSGRLSLLRRLRIRPQSSRPYLSDLAGGPIGRLPIDLLLPPAPVPLEPQPDELDGAALLAWMERGGPVDPEAAASVWDLSWFGPDLAGLLHVETLPLRGRIGRSSLPVYAPFDPGPLTPDANPDLLGLADGLDFLRELSGRRSVRHLVLSRAAWPNALSDRRQPDLLVVQTLLRDLPGEAALLGVHAAALHLDFELDLTGAPPLAQFHAARAHDPSFPSVVRDWRLLEPAARLGRELVVPVDPPEVLATALLVASRDLYEAWPLHDPDDDKAIERAAAGCLARLPSVPAASADHLVRYCAAAAEALALRGVDPQAPLARLLRRLAAGR